MHYNFLYKKNINLVYKFEFITDIKILRAKMEYVYLRNNPWFQSLGVYKMGYTKNIPDRNQFYIDKEIILGKFVLVIETKDGKY